MLLFLLCFMLFVCLLALFLLFFLHSVNLQVEERSHEVWGGEEGLEKEREMRSERQEKKKEKKYAKEIKGWWVKHCYSNTLIKICS